MAFQLSEAGPSDLNEIIGVLLLAFKNDEIWKYMTLNVTSEDEHDWVMAVFGERYQLPDISCYKIIEVATGKIVAFTALEFPWSIRPLPTEAKEAAISEGTSQLPPLKGVNEEVLLELFAVFNLANKYGYDPEKDYHRKGTMVHPEFQKMGHGSWLTRHCNEIADKTGSRTFVGARPSSIKMFNNLGFKTIGMYNAHMERWGGDKDKSISWLAMREPQLL